MQDHGARLVNVLVIFAAALEALTFPCSKPGNALFMLPACLTSSSVRPFSIQSMGRRQLQPAPRGMVLL